MISRLKITSLLLALACVQLPANAVPMYFDYTLSGGEFISGTLDGDVQQDGDTVIVNQMLTYEYLGVTADASDYFLSTFTDLVADFPGNSSFGFVSFSGDFMDLASCDFALCSYGLLISNNATSIDNIAFAFDTTPVTFIPNFGFDTNAWNLDIIPSQVPEPSSLILLLAGCIGIALGRKATQHL